MRTDPQPPGWWILVTFFAMQPKSSLVLGRSAPQKLTPLIAMDISYKKPCQYGRWTLSVTDCNVQKKKCQFFLVSYYGWYVDKLDITSQSRNYAIVILPTTRYKLSACSFSAFFENSKCCSIRISGFVRCLVWRTCEQMQHTHIAMYYSLTTYFVRRRHFMWIRYVAAQHDWAVVQTWLVCR